MSWMPGETRLSLMGDLALFLGGSDDSFTGDLLRLIARADPRNRHRLRQAFPREVRAWETWMKLDNPTAASMREAFAQQEKEGEGDE